MLAPADLEAKLKAAFDDATIELRDLTGTQDHYELLIVSDAFAGVSPIQRHRLVYASLGRHMGTDIHALTLRAFTSQEWSTRLEGV